jgi:hypothetical protein
MKAILRWSAGLLSLLLLGSVCDGYYWVTPVFKQPYPVAPSPSNSGFYLVDAYGRLIGPHYYLVPPCQPFNGMLPGKTGQAIQQGYLPHTLLLSKEGMVIGKVPRVGEKGSPQAPGYPQPGAGLPQSGMARGPGPYAGNMQMPYGYMPSSPYPGQAPYPQPMPYGNMPQPMPYGAMPNSGQPPFMPIPGFNPSMPSSPMMPGAPMMPGMAMPPGQPGMNMGPGNGFPSFSPMPPFNQFNPLQGPQPPRMEMQPMQMPRMDMMPPPPRPGNAYPSHPFARSPRDFFMWGENMDEERARGSRPFPVP